MKTIQDNFVSCWRKNSAEFSLIQRHIFHCKIISIWRENYTQISSTVWLKTVRMKRLIDGLCQKKLVMIPLLLIGHVPWSLHSCPCACLTCASILWRICLVANFVGRLCSGFSMLFSLLNKFWRDTYVESLFDEISPVNEAEISFAMC